MLFNSYTFAVFFAIVLTLHSLPLPWRTRKFNLLWASYLFYAAWNPPFVALLWISTIVDWFVAKWLYRTQSASGRRTLLVVSLCTNLGLLGFFKYGQFLLDNFLAMLALWDIHYQPAMPDIILPVGISFYTFQTLSYTLDVYRRHSKPWESFLDYALYVTFFPQLVAGPIIRASYFLPQCQQPRKATSNQLGWGLSLLVLGLFQKIVVADGLLAPVVETVYDKLDEVSMLTAWVGTLAFAGQIFCDFAGYSTSAIGVAMCLGFSVPDNFRFPYAAIGFSDFWQRWHISLSTWLRDYLYIPLGGNRRGAGRTLANLMMTMLLGGLWHGAAWTFVAWGGLHGLYLIAERLLKAKLAHLSIWRRPPVRALLGIGTFLLICFTWVFFRAKSFDQAFAFSAQMMGVASNRLFLGLPMVTVAIVLIVLAAILLLHGFMRDKSLEEVVQRCPWWVRAMTLAAMFIAIFTMPGEDRAFIYFQF